jgi:hypothetical protein
VLDSKILTDYDTLFTTVVKLEAAFIAAYMAAAREFADMNKPDLVKVAYQIGTVEAEHRVLANYALGARPANNLAFQQAMFATVGDAANALKQFGFIGGSGMQVNYPGPDSIDKANGARSHQPVQQSPACRACRTPVAAGATTYLPAVAAVCTNCSSFSVFSVSGPGW